MSEDTINISQLRPGAFNTKVLCIVINKSEVRAVSGKKDPNETKYVLNFTLRDSEGDTINASLWGYKSFVQNLADSFHMADVVEIRNPTVQIRPNDNERFNPSVSSPFQLSFGENRGEVRLRCDQNSKFQNLLSYPPQSYSNCWSLADVIYSGDTVVGQRINLLVAVRSIDEVTEIGTKGLTKLEMKVFDQSYPSFLLTLWGAELCGFAKTFVELKSVILLYDVKIQFNNFRKTITASSTSATLLVINPDCKEGHDLFHYATNSNISMEDEDDYGQAQLDNIPVVTVSQMLANVSERRPDEGDYRAIIYGVLTKLDLDGPLSAIIVDQCANCRQILKKDSTCSNKQCSVEKATSVQETYSINISISDHTGTIENCTMKSDVAAKFLGFPVPEFKSDDGKTPLKWNYLLERCKVAISANVSFKSPYKSFFRVLSFEVVNLNELLDKI